MKLEFVPYRSQDMFAPREIQIERRADGSLILQSVMQLNALGRTVLDHLPRWAAEAPERVFLAERTERRDWRQVSYREAWLATRAIGEALLLRGAVAGDRVAILSGNSIDHALVMLGAMAIGCCVSPLSPNYSLLGGGGQRLKDIGAILKPAFVYAKSARVYGAARSFDAFASARWISSDGGEDAIPLSELLATEPSDRFDVAFRAITPDMPAKILFTSGSTGSPKGVINTHRMLVSALEMSGQLVKAKTAPVQLEWLPWHHTMGGNAIFNAILKNGGTHYIDDGRPTPEAFGRTIENLRQISPTSMLNVPLGYIMLADALERDAELRVNFFRDIRQITYGGAALPKSTIDRLQRLAVETIGQRVPIMSGYGATEAAPNICLTHWPSEESGELGLPGPGLKLKLLPVDGRYELRIKGPNVTPGYYGRPELNEESFDEEGFYKVGDAVTFVDPSRPESGLLFAGRLSESFKLNNGTWVVPDEIRRNLLKATAGVLRDVVVAGENRDSVAVLFWPNPAGAAAYVQSPAALADAAALSSDTRLIAYLKKAIGCHNSQGGSSSRVSAFAILDEPPSFEAGEVTDKGSINQRAALVHRAALVEALYARPRPAGVFEPVLQ